MSIQTLHPQKLNHKYTLHLVITAWNEPETTAHTVDSAISIYKALISIGAKLNLITILAPDKKTHDYAQQAYKNALKKHSLTQKHIKLEHIVDPKKGKPYALNLILPKLTNNISIFTDGDIVVKPHAFINLLKPLLQNPKIGATTGRPIPLNKKDNMLGFWAWLTTQAGAHKHRLLADKYNLPINLSGYLFAVRSKLMPSRIPSTLKAEDAYFSYLIRKSGYKIKYTPRARVYVMFPRNFRDWIKQKVRAVGGDHQLNMMFKKEKEFKNMRSFFKEVAGIKTAIVYPKTLKQYLYLIPLLFARLYLWMLIFWKYSIKREMLNTVGWERVESTKIE